MLLYILLLIFVVVIPGCFFYFSFSFRDLCLLIGCRICRCGFPQMPVPIPCPRGLTGRSLALDVTGKKKPPSFLEHPKVIRHPIPTTAQKYLVPITKQIQNYQQSATYTLII